MSSFYGSSSRRSESPRGPGVSEPSFLCMAAAEFSPGWFAAVGGVTPSSTKISERQASLQKAWSSAKKITFLGDCSGYKSRHSDANGV